MRLSGSSRARGCCPTLQPSVGSYSGILQSGVGIGMGGGYTRSPYSRSVFRGNAGKMLGFCTLSWDLIILVVRHRGADTDCHSMIDQLKGKKLITGWQHSELRLL